MLKFVSRKVQALHNDEKGMESLQSVMLLALGAMVLVGLNAIYNSDIKDQVIEQVGNMFVLEF